MRMRTLGLVVLAALFVVVSKPQAQPLAEDPVIPMPIVQDNGPGSEIPLVSTNTQIGPNVQAGTQTVSVNPLPPASQPGPDKTGPSGAIKLPSTAFEVCYLFHSPDAQPQAVVLWRAIGQGAQFDPREVRERISLQTGQNPTLKGVYALQSDYRVQKLSLSNQDAAHVFELLQPDTDGKTLLADPAWKAKVASSLKEVEYDPERSKELRKLAAQRARDAKKAARSTSQSKTQQAKSATPAKTKSAKSASARKKTSTAAKAKPGKTLARR